MNLKDVKFLETCFFYIIECLFLAVYNAKLVIKKWKKKQKLKKLSNDLIKMIRILQNPNPKKEKNDKMHNILYYKFGVIWGFISKLSSQGLGLGTKAKGF